MNDDELYFMNVIKEYYMGLYGNLEEPYKIEELKHLNLSRELILYLTNVSRKFYTNNEPFLFHLRPRDIDLGNVQIIDYIIRQKIMKELEVETLVEQDETSIVNTLQDPEEIDPEINERIKDLIRQKVESRSLSFHDVMEYLTDQVEKKDVKTSKIVAYYCVNIVINSQLSDYSKTEIIYNINYLLRELEEVVE